MSKVTLVRDFGSAEMIDQCQTFWPWNFELDQTRAHYMSKTFVFKVNDLGLKVKYEIFVLDQTLTQCTF